MVIATILQYIQYHVLCSRQNLSRHIICRLLFRIGKAFVVKQEEREAGQGRRSLVVSIGRRIPSSPTHSHRPVVDALFHVPSVSIAPVGHMKGRDNGEMPSFFFFFLAALRHVGSRAVAEGRCRRGRSERTRGVFQRQQRRTGVSGLKEEQQWGWRKAGGYFVQLLLKCDGMLASRGGHSSRQIRDPGLG